MYIRDDIRMEAGVTDRPHIVLPMETTHALDIQHDRLPIRRPGQPITLPAETIDLTTREFQRRGHTIRRPRDRPILISPSLIFPSPAHFPTIRAGLIRIGRKWRRIDLLNLLSPSRKIGPLIPPARIGPLPSRPIVQQTRPEASRRTIAAR